MHLKFLIEFKKKKIYLLKNLKKLKNNERLKDLQKGGANET